MNIKKYFLMSIVFSNCVGNVTLKENQSIISANNNTINMKTFSSIIGFLNDSAYTNIYPLLFGQPFNQTVLEKYKNILNKEYSTDTFLSECLTNIDTLLQNKHIHYSERLLLVALVFTLVENSIYSFNDYLSIIMKQLVDNYGNPPSIIFNNTNIHTTSIGIDISLAYQLATFKKVTKNIPHSYLNSLKNNDDKYSKIFIHYLDNSDDSSIAAQNTLETLWAVHPKSKIYNYLRKLSFEGLRDLVSSLF